MNAPWSTADNVAFVMDKWPDEGKAALLAALLKSAGAVKVGKPSTVELSLEADFDLPPMGGKLVQVYVLPIPEDTDV